MSKDKIFMTAEQFNTYFSSFWFYRPYKHYGHNSESLDYFLRILEKYALTKKQQVDLAELNVKMLTRLLLKQENLCYEAFETIIMHRYQLLLKEELTNWIFNHGVFERILKNTGIKEDSEDYYRLLELLAHCNLFDSKALLKNNNSERFFLIACKNSEQTRQYIAQNTYITDKVIVCIYLSSNKETVKILKNTVKQQGKNIKDIIISYFAVKYGDDKMAKSLYSNFENSLDFYKSEYVKKQNSKIKGSIFALKKILKAENKDALLKAGISLSFIRSMNFKEAKLKCLKENLFGIEKMLEEFPYFFSKADCKVIDQAKNEAKELSEKINEFKRKINTKIDTRDDNEWCVDLLKSYGTFDTYLDSKACYDY